LCIGGSEHHRAHRSVHGLATVFGCDICDIPEMEGDCDGLLFCKHFRSAYLRNFQLVELTGNEDSNCLGCSDFFWIFVREIPLALKCPEVWQTSIAHPTLRTSLDISTLINSLHKLAWLFTTGWLIAG
jgi:hypothetical protein